MTVEEGIERLTRMRGSVDPRGIESPADRDVWPASRPDEGEPALEGDAQRSWYARGTRITRVDGSLFTAMTATDDNEPEQRAAGHFSLQRVGALLGAVAAFASIVAFAIAIWPKHKPLAERVKPHLTRLNLANQNLSAVLSELRRTSNTKLARARSDTALVVSDSTASAIDGMDIKKSERQLENALRAALVAEGTYLHTVDAFLRRKASRTEQRNFWQVSERLRNRLDDLNASVPVIGARSIGGANVLAAWFRNKTGKRTAISKFPPAQRVAAQHQIPPRPAGSTTTTRTQCNNSVDDDGDSKTDMVDPGCTSASDDSEADTV